VSRIVHRSLPWRTVALKLSEAILIFTVLFLCAEDRSHYGEVGLLGSVFLLCMYCLDVYKPWVTTHQTHSISRIMQAAGVTMLIIAAIPQTWLVVRIGMETLLSGMALTGVALIASRYLFAEVARREALAEPAIVWGSGPLAASIIRELRQRPDLGIRVLGVVDHAYDRDNLVGERYLGSPEAIWRIAESGRARRIIIAVGERRGCLPVEELMAVKLAGLSVEDGTELYEELTGKVWLEAFSTSVLLFSPKFRKSGVKLFLHRCFSLLFAVIALILTAPVLLITAVLVRLDSEGPAIFRQTRVGQNGRHFTLYKFRSMTMGAERAETLIPATRDDPRFTRVGRWIRRFRIDELPQLFNIVKGDMYFVGPRPFVPDQEEWLVDKIPHYRQRWVVRPGATGWAQVHRGYCSSLEDNTEKLSYDLFYIKNLSMRLDLVTLVKTFKTVLLGRGGQ
jgi:exopolysaccharide biosynthesis polyprenyl glycosylphosphotransferase